MIVLNKIIPNTVEVFSPDNQSLGMANEFEVCDLQCQIAENKAIGYYLIFEGKVIKIDSKGELSEWPAGMFDLTLKQFQRLHKARKS